MIHDRLAAGLRDNRLWAEIRLRSTGLVVVQGAGAPLAIGCLIASLTGGHRRPVLLSPFGLENAPVPQRSYARADLADFQAATREIVGCDVLVAVADLEHLPRLADLAVSGLVVAVLNGDRHQLVRHLAGQPDYGHVRSAMVAAIVIHGPARAPIVDVHHAAEFQASA